MEAEQKELEDKYEVALNRPLSDKSSTTVSKNPIFKNKISAKASSVGPSDNSTESERLKKVEMGHDLEEERNDLETRIKGKQWKVSFYYLVTALITIFVEIFYLYLILWVQFESHFTMIPGQEMRQFGTWPDPGVQKSIQN